MAPIFTINFFVKTGVNVHKTICGTPWHQKLTVEDFQFQKCARPTPPDGVVSIHCYIGGQTPLFLQGCWLAPNRCAPSMETIPDYKSIPTGQALPRKWNLSYRNLLAKGTYFQQGRWRLKKLGRPGKSNRVGHIVKSIDYYIPYDQEKLSLEPNSPLKMRSLPLRFIN